jgi:3-methyladenine DNA glycosylase AlkD
MARFILAELQRSARPEAALSAQRFFKTKIIALGVSVPQVRRIVREQVKAHRKEWGAPEATLVCDLLMRRPETEPRMAGLLFLGEFADAFPSTLLNQAERWLKNGCDNWALVDTLAPSILTPLLERYPGRALSRFVALFGLETFNPPLVETRGRCSPDPACEKGPAS